MKKKVIVSILIILIVLAGTFFGVKLYRSRSSNSNPISAYAVSNFLGNYYEYSEGYSGTTQNSTSQNVYVNTNQIVQEVLVSEGDNVKKGDVLLIYDTTALSLQLETNKARLEQTQTTLTVTEHRLSRLYNITPVKDDYVPVPTEAEKAFDKALAELEEAKAVLQEFELAEIGMVPAYDSTKAAIAVCEKKQAIMDAVINLTSIKVPVIIPPTTDIPTTDTTEAGEPSTTIPPTGLEEETDVEKEKPHEEPMTMEEYESLREAAILQLKLAKSEFDLAEIEADKVRHTLETDVDEKMKIFQEAQKVYDEEQKNKDDGEIYTESELARAIRSAKEEIRDLQLSIRQQDLSIRQQEKSIEDGTVKATMDGVVITADTSEEKISSGKPVITVSGGGTVEVRSSINEWKKDSMPLGTTCTIYCYETGQSYEGVVTDIQSSPTNDIYSYSNMVASNYPMIISVSDADDLTVGLWVEVRFDNENSNGYNPDEIVLPTALTRSENGNYYVMKDVGGKLAKQYIKTGKIYYGSEIVVKEGITSEDYIAFPYDKNAYEGKACVDVDDLSSLYGY